MRKLRDTDLWPLSGAESLAEYIYAQPIAYQLHGELKRLRLEAGDVGKVNVHPRAEPAPYAGEVVDGTTAVEVRGDLAQAVRLAAGARNPTLLALLVDGLTRVLGHFGVAREPVDEAAARIVMAGFRIRERLATARVDGLAAELWMNWNGEDAHCVLTIVAKPKGQRMSEHRLCTAFLIPDRVKENLVGLEFESPQLLRLDFKAYDDSQRRFGVQDLDPVAPLVRRSHDAARSLTTLRVDLPAWRAAEAAVEA